MLQLARRHLRQHVDFRAQRGRVSTVVHLESPHRVPRDSRAHARVQLQQTRAVPRRKLVQPQRHQSLFTLHRNHPVLDPPLQEVRTAKMRAGHHVLKVELIRMHRLHVRLLHNHFPHLRFCRLHARRRFRTFTHARCRARHAFVVVVLGAHLPQRAFLFFLVTVFAEHVVRLVFLAFILASAPDGKSPVLLTGNSLRIAVVIGMHRHRPTVHCENVAGLGWRPKDSPYNRKRPGPAENALFRMPKENRIRKKAKCENARIVFSHFAPETENARFAFS
eukprot:2589645-Rhodomonas_salina.2